ncbi:DUF4351 domain-containing protein [Planctomycetota bacterium]
MFRLGTKRFGELEPSLQAEIESMESLDEVEKLRERLLYAVDWNDLLSNNM